MAEKSQNITQDAILMGGKDPDRVGFNGQYKFMLEVGGKQIIDSVLTAFDQSKAVSRIFFVGPSELIEEHLGNRAKEIIVVSEAGSFWENLDKAANKQQQMGGKSRIMIAYSDLPFLQPESIDWVATKGGVGDVCVPAVPQNKIEKLSPTYETYFWPMKEFPFKWGDLLSVNLDSGFNGKLEEITDQYRAMWSDNLLLTSFRRLTWLYKNGGSEAVSTVMLNFASKLLQMKLDLNKSVPFSQLRSQQDYEKVLSAILGISTKILETPFVDIVLDVDNPHRLGIFDRGHEQIRKVVEAQKD